jgi:hypothetical protein
LVRELQVGYLDSALEDDWPLSQFESPSCLAEEVVVVVVVVMVMAGCQRCLDVMDSEGQSHCQQSGECQKSCMEEVLSDAMTKENK